ncbi:Holliday junction resolvase RecU [Salinibacillus xinjiangensis]|uniref:Holliday junction resolvase RecU n=1 Tax=Salinibacillus xinjiangensis TaxID=1229268 RepID=A0A6G1XB91_9BACI|nr:Holliday junction resolvase RecU [Salinibacillus xinjiangensis]MRG88283.1 Holliday junction resolvase RecU [Salinibacillus xinjiangensis]
MRYPNGRKKTRYNNQLKQRKTNFGKRGMTLESEINETNLYYLETNRAVVHKKPTPVQIVQVDYPKRSAAVIREAYFKQASTTDYNGLYKGKYIDFEAKETRNRTSLPLANIHQHQVDHMKSVIEHDGICFLIIRFNHQGESYLLPAEHFLDFWNHQYDGGRKSVPLESIQSKGYKIPFSLQAKVDYLKVLDQVYL